MKKSQKKLALNRETLRQLNPDALEKAVGAGSWDTTYCSAYSYCCSRSCPQDTPACPW